MDSPEITKLCRSLESGETFHVQSSGNMAFVRLQVLDNNKRFKFHASFDEVPSSKYFVFMLALTLLDIRQSLRGRQGFSLLVCNHVVRTH